MPTNKPIMKGTTVPKEPTGSLTGQVIIFYGFQCPILKADVEARGGKVTKNLSGVTTLLVMKDINSNTNNVRRAQEQNIKLISKDEFIGTYIH
jgi:BRCT domain type II-containing protein